MSTEDSYATRDAGYRLVTCLATTWPVLAAELIFRLLERYSKRKYTIKLSGLLRKLVDVIVTAQIFVCSVGRNQLGLVLCNPNALEALNYDGDNSCFKMPDSVRSQLPCDETGFKFYRLMVYFSPVYSGILLVVSQLYAEKVFASTRDHGVVIKLTNVAMFLNWMLWTAMLVVSTVAWGACRLDDGMDSIHMTFALMSAYIVWFDLRVLRGGSPIIRISDSTVLKPSEKLKDAVIGVRNRITRKKSKPSGMVADEEDPDGPTPKAKPAWPTGSASVHPEPINSAEDLELGKSDTNRTSSKSDAGAS